MLSFEKKNLEGVNFIDLFCGMGGFRLALESLGAKCVFSSEIDKYACEIYKTNFGEYPSSDITKISESEIPNHDILCAGFPCQSFSVSGLQAGFNDTRGTLFFEIIRIVRSKKPKIVFLENVKNIVSHENGKTFEIIKNCLMSEG